MRRLSRFRVDSNVLNDNFPAELRKWQRAKMVSWAPWRYKLHVWLVLKCRQQNYRSVSRNRRAIIAAVLYWSSAWWNPYAGSLSADPVIDGNTIWLSAEFIHSHRTSFTTPTAEHRRCHVQPRTSLLFTSWPLLFLRKSHFRGFHVLSSTTLSHFGHFLHAPWVSLVRYRELCKAPRQARVCHQVRRVPKAPCCTAGEYRYYGGTHHW